MPISLIFIHPDGHQAKHFTNFTKHKTIVYYILMLPVRVSGVAALRINGGFKTILHWQHRGTAGSGNVHYIMLKTHEKFNGI